MPRQKLFLFCLLLIAFFLTNPSFLQAFSSFQVRPPHSPRLLKGFSRGRSRYILLISIDGLAFDTFRRYRQDFPNLNTLARRGFWAPLQTSFPSSTWTAHTTIITGQYPRFHGVLGNRWMEYFKNVIFPYQYDIVEWDRRARTYALYDLAWKKKWKVAALNWPATQKARIFYNFPEIMYDNFIAYRYISSPLKKIIAKLYRRHHLKRPNNSKHLKALVGYLANSERVETDLFMRDIAVELLRQRRSQIPKLLMLHFVSPDTWQHRYGRTQLVLHWSMELIDRMVGKVIKAYKKAGIWKQTTVFIVSDHGFTEISYTMDLRLLFYLKGFNPSRSMSRRRRKYAKAMPFFNGHAAYIYIPPAHQKKLIPKIISLLRRKKYRRCIYGIFRPREYKKFGLPTPAFSRSKRIGTHQGAPTLLALTKPHCQFVRWNPGRKVISFASRSFHWHFGSHGFLPNYRDLWAIVIGAGRGIKKMTSPLPLLRAVDIAPTIAHLLGLRWPSRWPNGQPHFKIDGRLITKILQP